MDEWLKIYRNYSATELDDEIEWLREQSRNPFEQQQERNRSFSRSTAAIRDRLSAALQVRNERKGEVVNSLQVDFSKGLGG